jgi:hypothetical protein
VDTDSDVELATLVMRRLDQQDRAIAEMAAQCEADLAPLRMLAHHIRVACDGVAAAAEMVSVPESQPDA